MKTKKVIKRSAAIVLLAVLGIVVYIAWGSLPIISGFGAKGLCSCVFISGRTEDDVKKEELADKPLNFGTYTVDYTDSSVTGKVFGFAKQKAIYRKGLGCTLVNDYSEAAIRSQQFDLASPPATNPSQTKWPDGDLLPDSLPPGIAVDKIRAAIELPFAEPDAEARIHTQAALVVYKGQIVAEKYAPGFNKDTRLIGWSMGKSITSALIGILVKQGKLDISKPAPVAEWKNENDPLHAITLQNLLQQTTGLDFEENYSKPSGATNMLFKRGDMAAYAANSPLKHKPGSTFYYSSGNSNILARIVRTTVGEKDYESFLFNELFYKIGMNDFIFEPDASGTFVGSSYPFGTARDYARFGLLYLNDGVWNGERILPEGWVKQTTTPAAANNEKEYGFQFWLNGISAENPQQHIYPNVPADMFYADGYNGQRIYIIPSRQLVVVRLGLHKFDENKFLEAVLDAVE